MHVFNMPAFTHETKEHKKIMAFHSIEEQRKKMNNKFLKIAGVWKDMRSFRILDSYKAKPRIAANKPDGDLLDITPLEQTFALFKMTSHMLGGGTFLCCGFSLPKVGGHRDFRTLNFLILFWAGVLVWRFVCLFVFFFFFLSICLKSLDKSGMKPISKLCKLPKTFRSAP